MIRRKLNFAQSTSLLLFAFYTRCPACLYRLRGVKRLQDIEPPEFPLRVGDYRVRFYDHGDTLYITSVRHRSEAYR